MAKEMAIPRRLAFPELSDEAALITAPSAIANEVKY
jgi:hypothetical protein